MRTWLRVLSAAAIVLFVLIGRDVAAVAQLLMLGAGPAMVSAQAAAWGTITGTLSSQTDLQTALNGKQAAGTYATGNGSATGTNTGDQTTISGNAGTATALQNARTINGVSFNGTANISIPIIGYTLDVQAITSSPTDAQTIYFGQLPKVPVTAQGTSRVYIRKAGTITQANILNYSGTAGTNEAWPCNIRLNNTGDTQIASVSLATSERVWSNTGLSIAVVAGDYVEIKCVNPTWATNPLTSIFAGYLYVE